MRRIVAVKDRVYVTRIAEDVSIDAIPLHEILTVTEMNDEIESKREFNLGNFAASVSLSAGKRTPSLRNAASADSHRLQPHAHNLQTNDPPLREDVWW